MATPPPLPTSSGPPEEIISIERESFISTIKQRINSGLTELIVNDVDKEEFSTLCTRVEAMVRAWYTRQFEELLSLYNLFDPAASPGRLEQQGVSPAQVEGLEERFLRALFLVMYKGQFKLLSDQEYQCAISGRYLLDVPISVDKSKIDTNLYKRFFERQPHAEAPSFSSHYLIFRRGLGVDRASGTFITEKIDVLISRIWHWLLDSVGMGKKPLPKGTVEAAAITRKNDTDMTKTLIERHRIETLDLSWTSILSPVTIQEPTFEKIILVYRRATTPNHPSDLGERGIHIQQFRNIPMADMEVVLPEKKMPGLTPLDWAKLIVTVFVGLFALISSLQAELSLAFVAAMFGAFSTYLSKIYFTWQASMAKYQTMLAQAMYDKKVDSGKATLLSLCDEVLQQEVKEVIVAYFVLMSQGSATKKELDARCEELMLEEFKEEVDFDVEDAVDKLIRLKIITKSAGGVLTHQSLKRANEIIGVTTEELVDLHFK
eukprot:TRINITY_DN336_c0_g1_i1.p1 TRINITY_DN336_c0_g1~~TRINITY_DN336_c0_g1_i1.p1  ORF type:complete len:489 (-),score=126.07 TRINITY_DN336_c0_g1_i1:914-2380(-)